MVLHLPSRRRTPRLVLLLAILLAGTVLRIAWVPSVPGGLNQDEAGAAYEALSLLETGKDKWGNSLPAYFPAWGSGQNVLYSYLLVPVIGLFGLSVATIRLPAVLLGILTLPLFYATLRRSGARSTALVATLLLAVLPWHVMASRWALESNLLPFCLLLGLYTTLRAQRSRRWIPFAFLPWAVALYAYILAVPTVALLMAGTLHRSRRSLRTHRLRWLAALLCFAVVAFPAAVFLAKNTLKLPTGAVESVLPCSVPLLPSQRWSQVTDPMPVRIARNAELFADGFEDGLAWNQTEHAPLSILAPLVVLAGLCISLVRWRRGPLEPFVLWFLACMPLFAITTLNINRANAIFLPSIALAAIALRTFYRWIRGRTLRRLVLASASAVLALVTASFAASYFLRPKHASEGFYVGLEEAYRGAQTAARAGEPVLLSPEIALPYLFALVLDRVSPAEFQRAHDFWVGPDGTYVVRKVGNTYFEEQELPLAPGASFVGVFLANEAQDMASTQLLAVIGDWAVVRKHTTDSVKR